MISVAVVGAGVVGSSLADALRRAGCGPTLFDPSLDRPVDTVPRGMLHPATGRRAAISRSRDAAFLRARDWIAELTVEGRGWWPSGLVRVTADAERAALWADTATRWPERLRWLDADTVRARVPGLSTAQLGGLYVPDAITVDARALVRAARRRCDASRRALAVTALEPGPDGVVVRTDEGSERFDAAVVCAASASAPLLAPFFGGVDDAVAADRRLRSVPGEMLIADGPAPPLPIGDRGQIIPVGPRRVVISSTHHPDETRPGARHEGVRTLLARAAQTLPSLADARPVAVWAGVRTSTAARRPIVGPVAPGVWACTGFGSKGFLAGLPSALEVASSISDDPSGASGAPTP